MQLSYEYKLSYDLKHSHSHIKDSIHVINVYNKLVEVVVYGCNPMLLLTTADKKQVVVLKKIQKRKWLQTDRERLNVQCMTKQVSKIEEYRVR